MRSTNQNAPWASARSKKMLRRAFFNSFLKISKPCDIYIIRIARSSSTAWDDKNPENRQKKKCFARSIFASARVSTDNHKWLRQTAWRREEGRDLGFPIGDRQLSRRPAQLQMSQDQPPSPDLPTITLRRLTPEKPALSASPDAFQKARVLNIVEKGARHSRSSIWPAVGKTDTVGPRLLRFLEAPVTIIDLDASRSGSSPQKRKTGS